jgi:hypothetical protein
MTKYIIEIGYEGCSEPGCCSTSKGFIFEANNLEEAETRADLSADDLDGWIIRCQEANEHDLHTYEVRQ